MYITFKPTKAVETISNVALLQLYTCKFTIKFYLSQIWSSRVSLSKTALTLSFFLSSSDMNMYWVTQRKTESIYIWGCCERLREHYCNTPFMTRGFWTRVNASSLKNIHSSISNNNQYWTAVIFQGKTVNCYLFVCLGFTNVTAIMIAWRSNLGHRSNHSQCLPKSSTLSVNQ